MEDSTKEIVEAINGLREDMAKPADGPMTREQAAAYLQIHRDTLYRLAREGQITYSRMGDGDRAPMRFYRRDLDSYLSKCAIKAVD